MRREGDRVVLIALINARSTKWDCGAGAVCAADEAATNEDSRRGGSPETTRGTTGAAGTARTGAATAWAPRPDKPVAGVEDPTRTRDAAARGAVEPGRPTAPTAPRPALHTAGTPRAGTAATEPPESPSPPASSCYCADPSRTAAAANASSAAPQASTPSSPWNSRNDH